MRALIAMPTLKPALAGALMAVLVIALFSQTPVQRTFDIGRNDAAVAQGFSEPESGMAGADGAVRRVLPAAALRLPQIGAPAMVTFRWQAPAGTPLTVQVNDEAPLQLLARGDWEEHKVSITGGWTKAVDVVIRFASPATNARILLDQVTLSALPPLLPYPAQLGYAALIGALAGMMLHKRSWRFVLAAVVGYGFLWLLFYRLSPYPLLYLPPVTAAVIAAGYVVWQWPRLSAAWPRWSLPVLALAIALSWMVWLIPAMQAHVTLARPGVENDFRVFATRDTLATISQADGFYNLGYPLLLWLIRPLTSDNAFLAARLIALVSGGMLIGAGYLLARSLLPPAPAALAAMLLALSGMVAQYGLLVGSDMPFAACFTLAVAVTLHAHARRSRPLAFLAGMLAGAAFLIRHPGLLLLLWGASALWFSGEKRAAFSFVVGFAVAAAPQVVVNTAQTGQPLFNQQAKNIWLAVYANTDWQRWDEVPNSISLVEVIGRDPVRFLTNWGRNIVGFLGAGAEDVSEFGRADQLRLLGWPANWLAIGGIAAAGWRAWRNRADRRWLALIALIGLYVAAIATAFILPRFFLPLAPLYAVAAAWALAQLWGSRRSFLLATLFIITILLPGPANGVRAVLAAQPADEVAAVELVQRMMPATDANLVAAIPDRLPLAKYSAIAHLIDRRVPVTVTYAELQALRADYLLWDNGQGPPPLPQPDAARIGAGRFTLYTMHVSRPAVNEGTSSLWNIRQPNP
ncbi:glycosyltransferase family 39 protein [Chloroflexus sp.]|uniref:glycosyltransferase family 39 protein n=1 Tax=Chloroflexus sp. TaxID=1904827 RepID=UPI002ACE114B|nr:glycosyltransferase family 39 protein [Chloroflexus sp.]